MGGQNCLIPAAIEFGDGCGKGVLVTTRTAVVADKSTFMSRLWFVS